MSLPIIEISNRLKELDNWIFINSKLEKEFVFENFNEVMNFISKISKLCEKLNHHPDFFVYDFKKIKVYLTTHSLKGVSELDFEFIRQLEKK